ncbi:hypothetical protein GCM10028818_36060 [Spirosoma horti]
MERIIYIQLLGEGTRVFRPVPALLIEDGLYELRGHELYDPKDEIWEFPPGTLVLAEQRFLSGGAALIAVRESKTSNV